MRRPIVAGLALGFVLTLAGPIARAATDIVPPEVLAWNRHGVWMFGAFVVEKGPAPPPIWDPEAVVLIHDGTNPDLVAGSYVFGSSPGFGEFRGVVHGKDGLRLKGQLFDQILGDGKFSITMDSTLDHFIGTFKFASFDRPKRTITISAAYNRFDYTAGEGPDVSNLELRLAFSERNEAQGLKTGKTADLIVFVVNHGPQAFPIDIQDLRLTFQPEPVTVTKIVPVEGPREIYPKLAAPIVSPVRVPLVVKDLLILLVRFEVHESLAGQTLVVDADFPVVHPGEPLAVFRTAHREIMVRGVPVKFTLRNLDDANPIHIFLSDDPDPFSEATRVPANGSLKLQPPSLRIGQGLTFKAGRNGSVLAQCNGTVLGPGKANIVYDPSMPAFLALCCGC